MSPVATSLFFVVLLVLELIACYRFYRTVGRRVVHREWFAWIIDFFALVSGVTLMSFSVYAVFNPWIFAINMPIAMFWALFIAGSLQASIHATKWSIRLIHK